MKTCTYCGRECDDNAGHCSGCGQDEFKSDPAAGETQFTNEDSDLVTLTTCPKLEDADVVVSRLAAAGIDSFIPDENEMQNSGIDRNALGQVRVQVRPHDYASARELLAVLASPAPSPAADPDGKKLIAALLPDQAAEVLERLKQQVIPAEVRTAAQESGLEMKEIWVEDAFFNRGCDVVEAWDVEKQAEAKKRSHIRCHECGSVNYERVPHERLGAVYKCQDCGREFI